MQVGQLDGVADLLDLGDQAADRRVVDVGNLFEDELLDLGLRHLLVGVVRPRVEQQRVAGANLGHAQRLREAYDALLVGVGDHQRAIAVLQDLLEHHDLADLLEREGGDHVECLVEHDLLAPLELVEVDVRTDVDPELAAAGEDIDRVVVVAGQERAEARRWLRQPVDLFLQRDDLVPCLAQRLGETLVLRGDRGEGALGVAQALLDRPRRTREIGQAPAQVGDLGLKEPDLASQLFAAGVLRCGHLRHLLRV